MKHLLSAITVLITALTFSQNNDGLWKRTSLKSSAVVIENKKEISNPQLYELDVTKLKQILATAPKRFSSNQPSNSILSFPNTEGKLEQFNIEENSNMDPQLAAKFPDIKSYIGKGIDIPSSTIYFSVSPLGLESMLISADRSAVFIEPFATDLSSYVVYKKSDKKATLNTFECKVLTAVQNDITTTGITARPNADDALMRTYRLALSVTGEYTAYFGGTKALALAAMNNTMTRVNGVFEIDFGVHMNLIANNDVLIYTNASTDPYSAASTGAGGAWNTELQNNLTNTIGNAAYDIGHLFGASGGGGNAGCIGCVCVDDTSSTTDENKGSGFTSPSDGIPSGDNFDIDYVAHEMGHQFGANHTFTHSNEGTGVQVEPGSGSTIMGYAGITSLDVQPHSDAYFHAVSIQQVTNYIKTTTCQTNTATGNAIPTANAGLDYTVPKSTPFMLTGAGTDANGDTLTYDWEQMDSQTTSAAPSATKTSGVNFRSYNPTTSPIRYFPKMSSVLAGATTTAGTEITVEALPSVARTLNFRLTVRDNHTGGPANNSDDMVVTVNATAGPFAVTSPNTVVSYPAGSTQTITWNVAGTTTNGVNCANVDILISTDGGTTWSTLLAATPNDGSQAVTLPSTQGTTNRIMVKGSSHIFFDVSNTNFTITAASSDTTPPSAPTLSASGTTVNSTNLSWTTSTDNVGVTGYDVYQGAVLLGSTTTATTYAVTGLTPSTAYSFTVKARDNAGNVSASSNTVSVTTLSDTTAPTAPTLSASGTTSTATNLFWTVAADNVGVTGYDVYKDAVLLGSTTTATTYAVTGLTANTTYVFTVKAKDASGNTSAASNSVSVTTALFTYCTSQGNSVADELIGRVQLGSIDNTSTGGTGYTDFTAISTNITQGTAQTITITPTWTSTAYSEGYAVFIDYNKDGDFADAGETVWTKAASTTTPVSGTFTVPVTATLGATRMRVSLKYNAIPTSCETFSYGQVEDYTVVVVADTSAPSTPTGLTASGTTQRTTNLAWTASTDNVAVAGYDIYKNGVLLGSTTTVTGYAVSGLTYATTYSFTVKAKDAAGNVSNASNTVNVTTLTPPTTTATSCGSYTWAVNNQTYTSSGTYTGINASGDTEFLNLTITSCTSVVNLKLFIEGYYNTTTHNMRPVKANQGIGSSTTLVDDIAVELRNSSTGALVATTTVALQTNGSATASFNTAPSGSFYLVVKHRNTLMTWSATPVTVGSTPLTYDFSNAINKAYGSNMILLESGVYGLYSGDIVQDGFLDLSDFTGWEVDYNASQTGYYAADLNGDGFVDLSDFTIWEANYNKSLFANYPAF
ncbi:reprolysin-like metallopeptidase [Flavobacterium sp. XGLA_31]|uniref:reprolysin-like metallopeptidase n=1 Tax=Flavobacterium sp. XGLA_31 TaxID=3447666 RepID=UPI003F2C0A28